MISVIEALSLLVEAKVLRNVVRKGWQQGFIGRVFLQLFPTDYLKLFER